MEMLKVFTQGIFGINSFPNRRRTNPAYSREQNALCFFFILSRDRTRAFALKLKN